MSDINCRMPAVALRGLVCLPDMILHFDVSRKKSIGCIGSSHGQRPDGFSCGTERSG